MMILALDLGKFNTMCCFFDPKIRKPEFLLIPTDPETLTKVMKSKKVDLVVMEACGPCGWISDLCGELKLKTLVCSTNEDAWRWANVKRKTDRDDAYKLARMASVHELKAVHIPTKDQRQFRLLVKYRKTMDQRITRIKNTIRSIFVNQGIGIPRGHQAWTESGRVQINSFRKPFAESNPLEFWKGQLDSELTQMDALVKQLEEVEKPLEVIAKKDPRIIRLMTIPGVGRKTAEALVASIDDPHRFKNGRQVSAYFGLVPKQFQSGEMDRNGRITKRGSGMVRSILVECAWCMLRYNDWAKEVYARIHGNQKTRKKKAAIALARKIAVVAWAMLRDEKDWSPATMAHITKSHGEQPKTERPTQNSRSESAPKEETSTTHSSRIRTPSATKLETKGVKAISTKSPSNTKMPRSPEPKLTRPTATTKPNSPRTRPSKRLTKEATLA